MSAVLTPKQLKKKQSLNKRKTMLRVRKHRQKKKDEGYKIINFEISAENKIILDRYLSYMKNEHKKNSYSDIFNDLIGKILKSRNKSLFMQGCRY
jgi:hypothetical protein